MSSSFPGRLRDLAAQDPAVAPLALLQAEALDPPAAGGPLAGVPVAGGQGAESSPVAGGQGGRSAPWPTERGERRERHERPLLDGARLAVDLGALRDLLRRLGAAVPDLAAIAERLAADPLPLLRASMAQYQAGLQTLADQHGVELAPLTVLGQVAALPLLQACGQSARDALPGESWQHGFCPVCGAWPTLVEIRGLERQRWLRCGRCGTGWHQVNFACVFCGNDEYRSQGYLAPEAEREARQAQTCWRCRGYLKALTTLGPLDPGELLLRDLQTLELDLAALDQGYARPEQPAVVLDLELEPTTAGVP